MAEFIGSASEYGLEYAENAFVKRQKLLLGHLVYATNLTEILSFYEKRSVA